MVASAACAGWRASAGRKAHAGPPSPRPSQTHPCASHPPSYPNPLAHNAAHTQVWPPEGGKDTYQRGALAKKLLSDSFDAAGAAAEGAEYSMPMSGAGG